MCCTSSQRGKTCSRAKSERQGSTNRETRFQSSSRSSALRFPPYDLSSTVAPPLSRHLPLLRRKTLSLTGRLRQRTSLASSTGPIRALRPVVPIPHLRASQTQRHPPTHRR